jgi:D-alanine-D-alanine ligase
MLFGGLGDEHNISIASAQNIALIFSRFRCWYWDKNNIIKEINTHELINFRNPLKQIFNPISNKNWANIVLALDDHKNKDLMFFNALHGYYGEDGFLAKLFEERGFYFTGSSSNVSKLAFNKSNSKKVISKHKILVAPEIRFSSLCVPMYFSKIQTFLQFYNKIILKPEIGGSSIGLYFCQNNKELEKCLKKIYNFKKIYYLAEMFIDGIEISVAVIENKKELRALTCIEICVLGDIFDYKAKYFSKLVKEIIPARISIRQMCEAKKIALDVHRIIGCRGYSRIDMIVSNNDIYFLEINTLPGLSKKSLMPKILEYENISMKNFVMNQLLLATML